MAKKEEDKKKKEEKEEKVKVKVEDKKKDKAFHSMGSLKRKTLLHDSTPAQPLGSQTGMQPYQVTVFRIYQRSP